MPRRPRTNKRRDLLSLDRDMMLFLGPILGPASTRPCPEPGSEEWEALRGCWEQHPGRWGADSWGWIAFELGDIEAAVRANPLTPV